MNGHLVAVAGLALWASALFLLVAWENWDFDESDDEADEGMSR